MSAFEQRHRLSLPNGYRRFLKENNGGRPVPEAFTFPGRETGSLMRTFYSVNGPERTERLPLIFQMFENRIPDGFFPFGRDAFGNQMLLQLSGPGTGRVYFWDHEYESDDDEVPTMENMTLLADSFEEFLSGLAAPPE